MKTRVQVALLIGAALYFAWGLSLLLALETSQRLISTQEPDSVTAQLLGASFLGWAVACVIAARDPAREIIRALVVAMLIIGAAAMGLMFVVDTMPVQATNVVSLVVDLGVAGFLVLAQLRPGPVRQRRRPGPEPSARKKTAAGTGRAPKKAVKTKAVKKKAVKTKAVKTERASRPAGGKKRAGGRKKAGAPRRKAAR